VTRLHFVGALERTLFLRKLALLRGLASRELAVLTEVARERFVRAGEAVLVCGECVSQFFIVVDGWVRVTGGEHPSGIVQGPEQPIGFLSLLSRDPEGLEVEAATDALLLEIDGDVVFDLLEENHYFTDQVIVSLGRELLAARREVAAGTHLGGVDPILTIPDRPLTEVERLLIIRSGPLGTASLDALGRFARSVEELRYPAGTRLWSAGDLSGATLVILSGRVRCVQPERGNTFTCGPGYPLGNVEAQCRERRWYDATAETDLVVLRGTMESFHDVLEDDFELAMTFVSNFAGRLIALRREAVVATPA
jgi:CRP-like cAMP-binding protein